MTSEHSDPGDAAGLLAEKEEVPQVEAAGGERHHLQEAEPGAGTSLGKLIKIQEEAKGLQDKPSNLK